MPELESISISGFKSIASTGELNLGPMSVIIGPNGSGKSNFIEVFSFLNAIREGRLAGYVAKAGGASRLLHFGAKTTARMTIRIAFENLVNQYEISLEPTQDDSLHPSDETAFFWQRSQYDEPYRNSLRPRGNEAGISDPNSDRIAHHVREHLSRWRVYHFHDTGPQSPLKTTADLRDNRFLRADGSNVAPFLYYLKKRHSDSYHLIVSTVKRIAPFFDDFELEPQVLKPDSIRLEWSHIGTDAYYDASSLSDGTLRFIALAVLFLQPVELRPSVILVDEPELGLHPYAIAMLASMAKQASVKTQVILSTQSPLLLDNFEAEQVLVADRQDGGTRLSRLDVESLEEWFEEYSLGQLWEKNLLGGRPSGEN